MVTVYRKAPKCFCVCYGGGHLWRQTGIFFMSRKGLSVVCVCVLIFLLGVRSGKFSTISLPSIAAFTIAVTISFIFRETLDASSILCGNPACGGCIGVEPGGEIINEALPGPSFSLTSRTTTSVPDHVQVQRGRHTSTGKKGC